MQWRCNPAATGLVRQRKTGEGTTLLAAALHPDRVLGIVNVATWVPFLTPPLPWREVYDFDADPGTDEGRARDTRHSWLRDWRGFAEFFFAELLPEAHSSKQYEDCVGWVMETCAEANLLFRDAARDTCRRPGSLSSSTAAQAIAAGSAARSAAARSRPTVPSGPPPCSRSSSEPAYPRRCRASLASCSTCTSPC